MPTSANRIDYASVRPDLVRILQSCRAGKARDAGYEDIEDLVQDAIARAIGREGTIAAYDPARSNWVTWFVRVADDCMRTAWRRRAVERSGRERLAHDPTHRPSGL
jgi:hypothetical protein